MESSAVQGADNVSVKAEPCEDVCIKDEPTFETVLVKTEPDLVYVNVQDEPSCENVSTKAEPSCTYVSVKIEPLDLSADHAVKDEPVLGPELVEHYVQTGLTPQKKPSGNTETYQHLSKDTNVKRYRCGHKPGILNVHIRKHSAEKAYKCGQCSYATAYRYNLQAHAIKHTDEKPYKCEQSSIKGLATLGRRGAGQGQSRGRTEADAKKAGRLTK
ncbi:zinc finger protein 571-like [Cydia amplana]|uniref:zinc finger protein 571-like n=1 Tax=Cydia amplana TaxID=1869771 RepID=UPI002FE66215